MTSFARWAAVARRELSSALRRPSYWFLFGVLVLAAWGFSEGNVTISSGDATAGGNRSHVTSVFAQSMFQSISISGMGAWFLAIGAGLVLVRDAEHRVGEVLHATRLTPREYVWGSFAGAVTAFLVIWGLYLGASVGFNHVLAAGAESRQIGPFVLGNYLAPTLLLGLPQIVFFAGVPLFLGAWTRRPIVVFAFPIAVLLVALGFLVSWSPSWLDPAINRALMLADPSGFRWLNETFLKIDRGVDFYNTAPLPPDTGFLLSRIALAAVGLLAVEAAVRNTARRLLRGDMDSVVVGFRRSGKKKTPAPDLTSAPAPAGRTLSELGMRTSPPGFFAAVHAIGRAEVRELLVRPGVYLFVPLILWQSVSQSLFALGPFDSPLLVTSGAMAARQFNTLSLLVCILLLFYTVESLVKERAPAIRRDLPGDSRRDRGDAPRQDRGQRRGGGAGPEHRPDRVRDDHRGAAASRRPGRLHPLAVHCSLGRRDGPDVHFLDDVRHRRLRPLPQPLHGVRTRAGDRDLHRLSDERGRGALVGHQLDSLELDPVERYGRFFTPRPRPDAEPPPVPESRPPAPGPWRCGGSGGRSSTPLGSCTALRPKALLGSGVRLLPFAVPPVFLASLLFFSGRGRRSGTGRRGSRQGLLAAQCGHLDRLQDAVGLPCGPGRRTRAPGAFRFGVRRLHVLQPPRLCGSPASHHRRPLGPDRVDPPTGSPTNRRTARVSSSSPPKNRWRPGSRSRSVSATTCSTPAA